MQLLVEVLELKVAVWVGLRSALGLRSPACDRRWGYEALRANANLDTIFYFRYIRFPKA